MPKKVPICGIYVIINNVNQKRYVGYSIDMFRRWINHKSRLNNRVHITPHLQAAWDKYGMNAFSFEILQICDKDKLYFWEDYWAKVLKTHDREFGYNIQPTSPDGKIKTSEETKKRLSDSNKGNTSWTKGKKLSKSHRDAISAGNMGRKQSEEVKLKISLKNKGRIRSKETCEKMRQSGLGRKASKEACEKMSKFQKGREKPNVIKKKIIDIVTGEIFDSLKILVEKTGLNRNTMKGGLNGNQSNKTNYRYLDDYLNKLIL